MGQPVAPTAPDLSQNPWNAQLANDQNAAAAAAKGGAMGANTAQQMLNQMGDASAYPAMQNQYGLGASQSTAIPGSASNPAFGSMPITVTVPDTASRGFNPWSLTGEANARGK